MAIDPRMIGSGIQMGRSLAPQGPPIQEMLGMRMQQQQAIMEIMKELLKTHETNMMSLSKFQMSEAFKAAANEDYDLAGLIYNLDPSRFGMMNTLFRGGKMGPAEDMLTNPFEALKEKSSKKPGGGEGWNPFKNWGKKAQAQTPSNAPQNPYMYEQPGVSEYLSSFDEYR